jgi:hypothetical protein
MTLEIDPVHEVERTLAVEIAELAAREIARGIPEVEVHLRDDTMVYLIDWTQRPRADAEIVQALDRGVADILRHRLGREVAGPPSRTHLSPQSRLVVLRLR